MATFVQWHFQPAENMKANYQGEKCKSNKTTGKVISGTNRYISKMNWARTFSLCLRSKANPTKTQILKKLKVFAKKFDWYSLPGTNHLKDVLNHLEDPTTKIKKTQIDPVLKWISKKIMGDIFFEKNGHQYRRKKYADKPYVLCIKGSNPDWPVLEHEIDLFIKFAEEAEEHAKEHAKEKHAHAKGKWKSAIKRVTWSQVAIHEMVQKLKLEQHQVALKKIVASFNNCSATKNKTTIYEADFIKYVASLNVNGQVEDIKQLYEIILKDWTEKQQPLRKFLIGLIEMSAENRKEWEKKGGAAKIAVEIARAISRIN